MAKRRNRLTYVPKTRRRNSRSTNSQSPSSSKREAKESAKKKRRTNEQRPANLKGTETSYSAETKFSPEKVLTSPKGQGKRGHKAAPSQKNEASIDRRTSEHIRDMTVTRRVYVKWKLLSASTRKYTKQVVESAVLSVLNSVGQEPNKTELHFQLKQLSERILTRLETIKGPPHKGDYSKMEAESNELEDNVISYNNQVEALERELAEQKRLLENDEQMLNSYNNKEQEEQHRVQLHPLLQPEPVNALSLPTLPQDAYSSPLLEVPVELEANGKKLAQSLIKLNQQTEQLGFSFWLEAVSATASDSC